MHTKPTVYQSRGLFCVLVRAQVFYRNDSIEYLSIPI